MSSALDAAPAQLGVARRRENFPLAFLCPPSVRAGRLAVYGYCRLVDDLGDELAGDRLAALDAAESELRAALRGAATHPVFVALQPVFAAGMPVEPFLRLIDANRFDQRVASYASWEEVDAYCALSAAPVGEMVLRLEGLATDARLALSASVCAGLQLANHWQDLREDAVRGRCYVPLPVLSRHGVTVAGLAAGQAPGGFVPMLAECLAEARGRLRAGWPLAASLRGRMRAEIAGFAAHGAAACDAVERAGESGLRVRPSARARGRAAAVFTALRAVVVPGPLPRRLA
ncbi:MAG TPA: squalene/phytoene synthase family protein [Candidatus Angelobacter sp.]|nr:squalene/phytoene synthase family protein [Candidatus Angelobacter sp.]